MGLLTLTFDLLTLKVVCKSHRTWGILVPNLGTLGLWILELFGLRYENTPFLWKFYLLLQPKANEFKFTSQLGLSLPQRNAYERTINQADFITIYLSMCTKWMRNVGLAYTRFIQAAQLSQIGSVVLLSLNISLSHSRSLRIFQNDIFE